MELSKNQHKLTQMKTSERIQKTKKHNEVLLLYQCTCIHACMYTCTVYTICITEVYYMCMYSTCT